MNLFLLSLNVEECALWHCDKHVVKMILEIVQMLYTAWHVNNPEDSRLSTAPLCKSSGIPGYKKAHVNHPMTKWVRESRGNYRFAVRLAAALALEFKFRYKKHHGCTTHVLWLASNVPSFETSRRTLVPQCMPDQYKVTNDSVTAYRNYYNGDKVAIAQWKTRDPPPWWAHHE